jgi:hypothetical protein
MHTAVDAATVLVFTTPGIFSTTILTDNISATITMDNITTVTTAIVTITSYDLPCFYLLRWAVVKHMDPLVVTLRKQTDPKPRGLPLEVLNCRALNVFDCLVKKNVKVWGV